MRRPSNYAIYNKLRPSEVGLEADKPENLKEGESYFATDTYRLYVGGKNNTTPFSVMGFPYDKLRSVDSTQMFIFFVDPELGDDDNDGMTFDTAKKSITGALDELPTNMMGFGCVIYCHPGETVENVAKVVNDCPYLSIDRLGTWINGTETSLTYLSEERLALIKNGKETIIRNDDALVIKSADPTKTTVSLGGLNTTVEFWAIDRHFGHWQTGYCQYDKIIIENTSETVDSANFLVQTHGAYTKAVGVGLKPGKGVKAIVWEASSQEGQFAGIHCFAGSGELFTGSVSVSRGLFCFLNTEPGKKFYLGKFYGSKIKYDTEYHPTNTNAQLVVDSKMTIWVDNSRTNGGTVIDLDSNDLEYNGEDTPIILLSADFEGTCQYDSTQITLTDNSTKPRTIKDYSTGEITQYLTPKIYSAGDNVLFDLPTSDPAVAGALWNDTGTVKVSAGP